MSIPAQTDEAVARGRPKSEEKARAILCSASRLFLERGLQGTSMDAVAREAGVSKQTVYGHFENKEALFRACIRAKVSEHGFSADAVPESGDVRALIHRLCLRFMDLIFDPEVVAMHRVVMAEALAHPRIAELFYENGPAATHEAVAALLRRLVEHGKLRPHDSDYGAWQLLNMSFGGCHTQLLFGLIHEVPRAQLDAHLRQVAEDFHVLYGRLDA
jgi:TetR/AcrR family transcriptional repressor of mexJK operon